MKKIFFVLFGILVLNCFSQNLEIIFPLKRTSFQTNELIYFSVVSNNDVLGNGLKVRIKGDDGSLLDSFFIPQFLTPGRNKSTKVEHFVINGSLLKPGHYTIEVEKDSQIAKKEFDIFSHIRRTSYKLIDWGSFADGEQLVYLGERNLGFNLVLGNNMRNPKTIKNAEYLIRGGADWMQACTMSGGHQMDLRIECDWSDPYVIRGGTGRVAWQAILGQTTPNCIGVHFYDEPGLTWWKDPKTGKFTPHNIPAQMKAFENSFNYQLPHFSEVTPDDEEKVDIWKKWARWKLSFIDSAWKHGKYGVSYVNPNYISCNQSIYGWHAYADGYYFNVARSLPVVLGHGGYDDLTGSYLSPLFFLDMGNVRNYNKDVWYLPVWYYPMPPETFRCEQYLCFASGIQGLAVPPPFKMFDPNKDKRISDSVVEFNRTAEKLGTIFTTKMKPEKPQVAFLYSISQCIDAQIKSGMEDNYSGGGHRDKLLLLYVALKMAHIPATPIVEEDILDGTASKYFKVIILTGINYLEKNVVEALQSYIASGGNVLMTNDCKVNIKGAKKLDFSINTEIFEKITTLWKENKTQEAMLLASAGNIMKEAESISKNIKANLGKLGIGLVADTDKGKLGIELVADTDKEDVFLFTHKFPDITYLFAVNVSFDFSKNNRLALKSNDCEIEINGDYKIYNLLTNGEDDSFKKRKNKLNGKISFGPGQMKAYALLKSPISKVNISDVDLNLDYTLKKNQSTINFSIFLIDENGNIIKSPVPLKIVVKDPQNNERYYLYRATENGFLNITLPFGLNEPAGEWKVSVEELISGKKSEKIFNYSSPKETPSVLGMFERAIYLENDIDRIYRFARDNREITIIVGKSQFDKNAGERLRKILSAWDIKCEIVEADNVKVRSLSEEEAKTWVGLVYTGSGQIKSGDTNPPILVGFDIKGSAILIGNPEDNKIIKFLLDNGFLPFTPDKNLPGEKRGMIAWQYYGVGFERESVSLIAYDEEGMNEALGTFYEIIHGIEPLTPFIYPVKATLTSGKTTSSFKSPEIVWKKFLQDRPISIKADDKIEIITMKKEILNIDKKGNILSIKEISEIPEIKEELKVIEKDNFLKEKILKMIKEKGNRKVYVYWGGYYQIIGEKNEIYVIPEQKEISCIEIMDDGLVIGLADGYLIYTKF